ncbi:uncharacterized protein LOC115034061 [Acyrthosiphon pisum]|uniref:THAP-type domain-containing protein n=2 Tax=Acyrthosiphon pisum TaxID=7029 RepID=A0A8R2NQ36_ACYPI|nr:uncharacterized protein LOC115034061 [Acyrthosiphon pisum]
MVWSCCIPFCESKGNKGSKLKLHKFPLDKNRQTLWVKSIQNFEPSYIMKKSHYVCQCHFLSTDYELNNLLKKTAVPSVFSEVITLLPYTIFEDNSNFPSQVPCDTNSSGNLTLSPSVDTSKDLAEELLPSTIVEDNSNFPSQVPCDTNSSGNLTLSPSVDTSKDLAEELLPSTIVEDNSNFPSQVPCDPNTSKNLAEELECYPLQLMKSSHNQSNSSKSPLKTDVKQDFAVIKKSCSPRKRKCFIGDFDVQDLNSPRKRLRYWSESQNTIKKYKREILLTKKKNKRLLNKIKNYRQLINHLKNKNYISDNCYSVIKVKTTNK